MQHVINVGKKVFRKFHSLNRLKRFLPLKTKKLLCTSLIFPTIDYCDVVYSPSLKVESQQSLQRAQNACVRYICNLRKFDRVSEHYLGLDWMRLDTRQTLHMLLLLYNILKSQGPQYFRETWVYLQTRRLASMSLLEIPRHRTRTYGDSYHVSVVRLWNSLNRDIRDSPTLGSFKISLVKHLKQNR
ncbi:hypothetical protein WDU94_008948 [Cyamophila willieti]